MSIVNPMDSSFKVSVEAASVRRQVEDQMRLAITQGLFAPGDHLSDRALQKRFQVSRTVVREAMRQLEAEDLIETIPHRGSFVRRLSAAEAREVYNVRSVLEAFAVKGFSRHASDQQVQQLQDTFDDLKHSRNRSNSAELANIKQRFYTILLDGCGNLYVHRMMNQILNHNSHLRGTTMSDPTRLPHMIKELQALMDAIQLRDEEAAWAASIIHVQNAAKVAIHILEQNIIQNTDQKSGDHS